ncbi:MAG: hypothetical protein EOO92_13775 [Pedobacter sp.]|nr:MAG: hypothetical protein EOO92_13775 [Pedobacter sp.]
MKFSRILIQCLSLLLLCCYGFTTQAQGTEQLDSLKNISIFKFGADTSGIKYLQADRSSALKYKDLKVYHYVGDSLKTYFGVPVADVMVYYHKNRLFRIDLSFGKIDKEYTVQEFNKIQNRLLSMYGKTVGKLQMTIAQVLNGGRWESKKTLIDHTRHSFARKRIKDNGIYGSLTFVEGLTIERMSPKDFEGE